MGKYDDIINLPHHVSKTRPKMPLEQRSAQFAPFAALKGFEEALREKERIIVPKVELYEEKKAEIDSILRNKKKQDSITVIYYNNENYVKVSGMITEINPLEQRIRIVDTVIPFADIRDILEDEDGIS